MALFYPSADTLTRLVLGGFGDKVNLQLSPKRTLVSLRPFHHLTDARLPVWWACATTPVTQWTLSSLPETLRTLHFDLNNALTVDDCIENLSAVIPRWRMAGPLLQEIALFWDGEVSRISNRATVERRSHRAGILLVPDIKVDPIIGTF